MIQRLKSRWRRELANRCAKRLGRLTSPKPIVSFTFDDVPVSASTVGAEILEAQGMRGTFYMSLGLLLSETPTGRICSAEDVLRLHQHRHEIGCHTFFHSDSWDTTAPNFEVSIRKNRHALAGICADIPCETFSYPISCPHPSNKRIVERHFRIGRGGGQTFNQGQLDLNYVSAFFLEQAANFDRVRQILHQACLSSGWMIFATHDVTENPTAYGVTPNFFKELVGLVAETDAQVLTVREALRYVDSATTPA
jgi:peptidoglycan/xylan/chitin deacetylase (PgdA/CDA1 family)